MKILTTAQVREADLATILREPISSVDLMERAASRCADWIVQQAAGKLPGFSSKSVQLFCGTGNNGGDGLVIARQLHQQGLAVETYVCRYSTTTSEEFDINATRLTDLGLPLNEIRTEADIPTINPGGVVVDALLGSGLSRPLEGIAASLVAAINEVPAMVVAIDLPSGLFGEDNRENDRKNTIKANFTLTFELPKLALLFPDNAPYVGNWQVLSIGLDTEFIAEAPTQTHYLTAPMLQPLMQPRPRYAHKGSFGHVALLVGSEGKMGAAVLATRAAVRSGAGLVTVQCPGVGYSILQTAVPEAMVERDSDAQKLTIPPPSLSGKTWGIGPGIGTDKETAHVLKRVIQDAEGPVVFDADALNLLAQNPTWLQFLPSRSILTPHPGEFKRLVGETDAGYDRHKALLKFAQKHRVYVILKGAHTTIAAPDGDVFFNATGNPGMATGGMGDVLTGLLTGLLAQGYSPKATCILGVFLHGLAGDLAAEEIGWEALIASDVVEHLGKAFLQLRMS